ncbi:uncharacterized protein LOC119103987 [Pollicipes pollicipes]|uniref:uncharacterized protein LOC119103987 n=1 Tax=Pollicipes pollicipes TaxID=41117 RepID=UPI0018853F85|nr:uncharacterized protein LOC119103987 [Pollicipes pollicipes]XP_037083595.1 uncharacterized protein LOC119103987 [Pollicipes pollicipes]
MSNWSQQTVHQSSVTSSSDQHMPVGRYEMVQLVHLQSLHCPRPVGCYKLCISQTLLVGQIKICWSDVTSWSSQIALSMSRSIVTTNCTSFRCYWFIRSTYAVGRYELVQLVRHHSLHCPRPVGCYKLCISQTLLVGQINMCWLDVTSWSSQIALSMSGSMVATNCASFRRYWLVRSRYAGRMSPVGPVKLHCPCPVGRNELCISQVLLFGQINICRSDVTSWSSWPVTSHYTVHVQSVATSCASVRRYLFVRSTYSGRTSTVGLVKLHCPCPGPWSQQTVHHSDVTGWSDQDMLVGRHQLVQSNYTVRVHLVATNCASVKCYWFVRSTYAGRTLRVGPVGPSPVITLSTSIRLLQTVHQSDVTG